jgi:hypothetical protein
MVSVYSVKGGVRPDKSKEAAQQLRWPRLPARVCLSDAYPLTRGSAGGQQATITNLVGPMLRGWHASYSRAMRRDGSRAEVAFFSQRFFLPSGRFALNREIPVCAGLRGGAGRTRTSNQTIISRQL